METITESPIQSDTGFDWQKRNGVLVLKCMPLEADGFTNAFSTRLGGVSPMPENDLNLAGFADDTAENIYENRRRFLGVFEDTWKLTSCWQVHGDAVRHVTDHDDAGNDEERCDALVCNTTGILVGVKTADCVPVLIGDQRTGAFSAIHAGWRGTVNSIVQKTIDRMKQEFDSRAEDLRAAIGPAAGVCCYEVGADVIGTFEKEFGEVGHLFSETRTGHARVDLRRANMEQLLLAGLEPERIHSTDLCTMCSTDIFFSYRREKRDYGMTGRLMSVIGKNR